MKIKIELELEDIFYLFVWRKYDKQTFASIGIEASKKVGEVIDKIANQVEPIIEDMERW